MWLARLTRLFRREPTRVVDPIGAAGESAAADHLRRKPGWSVVARNWRHRRDEIDLVCTDGDVLVFVEVKTRSSRALVEGRKAVDDRKRRALRRAVSAYLGRLRERPTTFRFDIVEVTHTDGRIDAVRHFENAPLFHKGRHPRP